MDNISKFEWNIWSYGAEVKDYNEFRTLRENCLSSLIFSEIQLGLFLIVYSSFDRIKNFA